MISSELHIDFYVLKFCSRFCGWVDVGLSPLGNTEAVLAADALLEAGLGISKIFTSRLTRANFTVSRVLEVNCVDIDILGQIISWCVSLKVLLILLSCPKSYVKSYKSPIFTNVWSLSLLFILSRQKLPLPEEKIVRDWRLNERHYGALTGLNKGD